MKQLASIFLIWSILGSIQHVVTAAEWNREELQQIVSQSSERYIKAFEAQDFAALAAMFTKDAEYVDGSGTVYHGRDWIEAEYQAQFENGLKGKLTLEVISIRPVADNVVIEDGYSTFEAENDGPVSSLSYTATHVRQADGNWLLASVRELEKPKLTPHENLKRLSWLLGNWRDESEDAIISVQWNWSPDGNFLLGEYDAQLPGQASRQGSHRIGWDAQRQQFRSWVFASSGGFSDGFWTETNGVWEVALTAALPEGGIGSGTLRYEQDGSDALIISQIRRQLDGEPQENFEARIVRVPPAPATSASETPANRVSAR